MRGCVIAYSICAHVHYVYMCAFVRPCVRAFVRVPLQIVGGGGNCDPGLHISWEWRGMASPGIDLMHHPLGLYTRGAELRDTLRRSGLRGAALDRALTPPPVMSFEFGTASVTLSLLLSPEALRGRSDSLLSVSLSLCRCLCLSARR